MRKATRTRWLSLISDYVDQTLPVAERVRLERHLAECPACTADLLGMQQVVTSLRQLPPMVAPRSFQLTSAQARQLRPSPAFHYLRVAAGLAAAFLLFFMALDLFNAFPTAPNTTTVAINTPAPTSTPDPNVGTLSASETKIGAGSVQGAGSTTVTPVPKPTATAQPTVAQPAPATSTSPVRWVEFALVLALVVLSGFAFALRPRAPDRLKF